MTLDELIQRKLADWRPDAAGQTLVIDHPAIGWKAAVSAECVETLGCRLREVVLTRTSPLASTTSLAEQARRIADRVTGLLEPLCLVEVDAEHGLAQLRSESPARRGENVQYYEVLRHADGTTRLGRFEVQPNAAGKRNPVAFSLTIEALGKVVADLASD
jgi:hypothetical protein